MRLRKLAVAVGLAGSIGANLASALGLGEITLQSALNQPLEAEIKLLKVRDLTEEEIIANLASREDFQRAGVDRLFFLTDLRFRIDLSDPSDPVIRVTSRKPIREPYLNFLLDTQWPSGRMLREYTLLMDLPTFSDESVRPIQGVQTQASSPQPSTRTIEQSAPAAERSAAPQASSGRAPVEVYGPITASDTLWEIALRVRPSRDVSVHQTMLAIQRLNPGAFINNNINLLRKGQVLRVPTADDIENVTARQAFNEVAYQNAQWSDSDTGAQLAASSPVARTPRAQEKVEGRVRLASPGSNQAAGSGKGGSETSGRVDALENELSIALEELDKSKRENADLATRMRELEAQMTTMQRLLEVSNDELRALQLASGQQPVTTDSAKPVTEAPATDSATADTPAPRPEPKAQPKKVVSAAKEPSLVETLKDNILWIGAAILALFAAIFLLLKRRKDEEPADEQEPVINEPMAEEETLLAEVDSDDQLFGDEEPDLDVDLDDDTLLDDDSASTEAETGDVVGEADIYIAYGKFDQAEDMLLKALDAEPNNAEVRVKLLEVYAETQDLAQFDEHYGQLLGLGDDVANQRAAELRQIIGGAGDFESVAAPAESPELESGDDALGLDDATDSGLELDLDLDENLDDLEFDLGEDALSFDEPTEGLSEPSDRELDELGSSALEADSAKLDDDLDFSLDFETEDELEGAEELDIDLESETAPSDQSVDLDDPSSVEERDEIDLDLADEPIDESLGDIGAGDEPDGEISLESLDLDTSDFETADLEAGVLEDTQALSEELEIDLDGDAGGDEPLLDLSLESELGDADNLEKDLEALSAEFEGSDLEDGLEIALDGDESLSTDLDAESALEAGDAIDDDAADISLEDDFSLDGDMGDIDLEALDQEVNTLAADLDLSADEEFGLVEEGDASPEESDGLSMDQPLTDYDLEASPQIDDIPPSDTIEAPEAPPQEDVFAEALSDVPNAQALQDGGEALATELDDDLETELDFLSDTDEAATKLDLARAYIDMGDAEGAKDILDEVVQEGSDEQRSEAEELLGRIG